MVDGRKIAMLGTGLIGDFYTMTLHGQRGRDRVGVVYSRTEERGRRSPSDGTSLAPPRAWKRPSPTPTPTSSSWHSRTSSTRNPSQ